MEVCTAELMGSDVANRALEVGSSGLGPALNHRLSIFNRYNTASLITYLLHVSANNYVSHTTKRCNSSTVDV